MLILRESLNIMYFKYRNAQGRWGDAEMGRKRQRQN